MSGETISISRRAVLGAGMAMPFIRTARAEPAVTYLKTEDGRETRVTMWPAKGVRRGIVLFSHGALSAPEKYERVVVPWAMAGFEVLAPLHVDSTAHPDHAKYGMVESWAARLQDMRALSAFVQAPQYVAAGHSYGGLVALTLGGAAAVIPPGVHGKLRDPAAGSVLALSPPGASPGLITREGYASLAVPALIQTGDKDLPPGIKDGRWQMHLDAYDASAATGNRYALILDGADHYFGGLICNFDKSGPPETDPLAAAVRFSTLFLQAFGAADKQALAQLNGALSDTGPIKLARK